MKIFKVITGGIICSAIFCLNNISFAQPAKKGDGSVQVLQHSIGAKGEETTILQKMRNDGAADQKIEEYIEYKKKQRMMMQSPEYKMWQNSVKDIVNSSSCANSDIGVENGNFATWTAQTCDNLPPVANCVSAALPVPGRINIVPAPASDACATVAGFPINLPANGSNFSIKLGNNVTGCEAEKLFHTFTVGPNDTNFIYQYAVVFEDPGHPPADQPFLEFAMYDQNNAIIPCTYVKYTAGGAIPGFQYSPTCFAYYKPWTIVGVNLGNYIGQQVTAVATNADCAQCGHWGYSYLDFQCGTIATSQQFCVGEDSVLLCAPNEPGFSYSWSTGGSTSCIIANPQINDTVIVNVIPPSGCGFFLVYNLLPTNINPGFTYTVNCNNSVAFTDTSGITGGTLSGWQWNFPSGTPSSFNGQNPPAISYPGPGTYTVTLELTSQAGCKDTSIGIPITILPPPTVTAGPAASICPGASATLCASGTSLTYVWNTGSTATCITVSPATNTSYTVVATDANGCTNSATTTVSLNTLPTITAGPNSSVCANNNGQNCPTLTAAGGSTYVWSPTTGLSNSTGTSVQACPTTQITYNVVGTDANGCTNTASVNVDVWQNPVVTATGVATICIGRDSSQLGASSSPAASSYSWVPSSGLSCTNCPNPWASPAFSNTYTVYITDINGCKDAASVPITVGAIPFVSAIAPTTICNGDSAQLFANTSNGLQPYSYYWFPPNDLNNPNQQNPVAGPANNTPYTVVVTDANGCTDDTTTYVYVQTVPSVTWASGTPALTCDGIVMPFGAVSSSNGQSIYWNFGDGTTTIVPVIPGDTISVPHTYPYGGTYSVTLVVFNPPCSDTLDTTMVVSDVMQYINILPANVFTPNGDGEHDCFHPAFCDLSAVTPIDPCPETPLAKELSTCLVMEIYDRWGVKMFETTDSEKCWDGKNLKGNDAVEGTYYYISTFGEIPIRGYLTLLRKKN